MRPTARRRSSDGGPDGRTDQPAARRRAARPVLTGRALVLGALVVLLVVVLASPVNRYLGSRRDVGHAAQELHDDRQALGALTRAKARYADPGYIQRQARVRLQFAMPGDTVYIVTRAGEQSSIDRTAGSGVHHTTASKTWNTRLWDSVRAAGQ